MKQEHEYVLNASQTKTYPFLYGNLQQDFIFMQNKISSFFFNTFYQVFCCFLYLCKVPYFRYSTILILVLLLLLLLTSMLKNRTKYKRQMCINMMLFRMSIYGHLTFIYFVFHTHFTGIFCKLYPMHLFMSRNKTEQL